MTDPAECRQPSSPPPPADAAARRPRLRALRRACRALRWAVLAAAAIAALLTFTPAGDWLGESLVAVDPLTPADYIVVLSGNTERAVEAARLYRDRWAAKVIISSNAGGIDDLVRVATTYGVPAEDIIRDDRAVRTTSHPQTVGQLPGVDPAGGRFIIVTSRFHTSRARACFVKAGYRNVCMRAPAWRLDPAGRLPPRNWTGRGSDLLGEVYETLAWGLYRLRGWV